MKRGKRRSRNRRATTPWHRRRRRTLIVLALFLVLLSPALVWRLHIRADLNQRLADLRQQALPVTMAELAAWERRDPREAEADEAYSQVFQSYQEMDFDAFQYLPKFEAQAPQLLEVPYSAETRRAFELRVAGNEATLEHLMEASRFPKYRLQRQYELGSPQESRDLARPFEVLFAQACLLAENGDGDGALEAVEAGLRIARACRATPFSEVLNLAVSYENRIVAAVPSIVVRAEVSGGRLRALEQSIHDDDWPAAVAYAVNGDRCQQFFWNRPRHPAEELVEALLGVRDRRLTEMLRYYQLAPELIGMTYQDQSAILEKNGIQLMYSWWTPPASRTYSPVPTAVLHYYHDNGKLPQALDDLVPRYLESLPTAPDTGHPPDYFHSDSTFVILEPGAGLPDSAAEELLRGKAVWNLARKNAPVDIEDGKPGGLLGNAATGR